MKAIYSICAVCLVVASPLFAQNKENERLANSAIVLQAIIAGDLPASILNKADCVVVLPGVKKVAVGIGASYGRGALVCRKDARMARAVRPFSAELLR
jgi:SH3 domain-containing YSC84-like protein 1